MSERLEAFRQMLASQLRQLYREPEFLFWAFLFPVLLTLGLGIAFRDKPPEPVAVAVAQGAGGPELLERLRHSPELTAELLDRPEALRRPAAPSREHSGFRHSGPRRAASRARCARRRRSAAAVRRSR